VVSHYPIDGAAIPTLRFSLFFFVIVARLFVPLAGCVSPSVRELGFIGFKCTRTRIAPRRIVDGNAPARPAEPTRAALTIHDPDRGLSDAPLQGIESIHRKHRHAQSRTIGHHTALVENIVVISSPSHC
jgi:hypothetical protein